MCTKNIKYRDKLKGQQEHDQQEIYKKYRERDKRDIRCLKKTEVKKYRYYSESEIKSEPEAYNSYRYDESNGKTLPPKKKIKRDRPVYNF